MNMANGMTHSTGESSPVGLAGMANAAITGIFFLLGGGLLLVIGNVESSPIAKIIWSFVYAVTGLLVFQRSRAVLDVVRRKPGFFLLSLLCLASIVWSSDRPKTISSAIAIFGSTLLGYLIATKVDPVRFLRQIGIALFILLSINVALMLPHLGANLSPAVRFHGIFPHPNLLGRNMGLATLVLLLISFSGFFSFRAGCVAGGMGALLLVSCDSMTSILALGSTFGLFLVRKSMGRPVGSGYIAVVLWFLFCFGGLIALNWTAIIEFLFGLIGRSPDLTGRMPLWEGIWNAILRKPYLGYGYSAFWSGEQLVGALIYDEAGWSTSSTHNGLLDIALSIGLVGVCIYVFTVGRALVQGFRLAFMGDNPLSIIFLLIICYLIILGFTESTYIGRNSDKWLLMLISSVYLQRISRGEITAPGEDSD